ncbi:MAG: gamma-glutamyl-gamma-aminobutyrate hydrolase family protein [Phycisphaerales bacterium]
MDSRPLIGISANVRSQDSGTLYSLHRDYARMVAAAGGVPVVLVHEPETAAAVLDRIDGVLITGGADVDVRPLGLPLHPAAEVMDPLRQEGEFALLRALDQRPDLPVLGICLGMQLMGVHAGCQLIQHLADHLPESERHLANARHAVDGDLGCGAVASSHHQALGDAGPFAVTARSDDGVIEAIRHPGRPFYLGVQWHPERTPDPVLGLGVIRRLVEAASMRIAAQGRRGVPLHSGPTL